MIAISIFGMGSKRNSFLAFWFASFLLANRSNKLQIYLKFLLSNEVQFLRLFAMVLLILHGPQNGVFKLSSLKLCSLKLVSK